MRLWFDGFWKDILKKTTPNGTNVDQKWYPKLSTIAHSGPRGGRAGVPENQHKYEKKKDTNTKA